MLLLPGPELFWVLARLDIKAGPRSSYPCRISLGCFSCAQKDGAGAYLLQCLCQVLGITAFTS